MDSWLKLVKERNGEKGYLIGIAANKSDLYGYSEVEDEEGKKYAQEINSIWKLTSALEENKGIDDLIDELLKNYINNEEIEKDINDINIRLDSSSFSEKNKGSCCGGKENKINDKDNIRYKSFFSKKSNVSSFAF